MKKFCLKLYNRWSHVTCHTSHVEHGLTFIELIVVATIFSILAAVSLFQFSDFNSNISLQNVSQDIALKIVQAQRAGSSGAFPKLRSEQLLASPPIIIATPPTFGLYFVYDQVNTVNNNKFFYFTDTSLSSGQSGNKIYDSATTDADCHQGISECLEMITINSGDTIAGLFAGTGETCLFNMNDDGNIFSETSGCTPVHYLNIAFSRPALYAHINAPSVTGVNNAYIIILSKKGNSFKTIKVSSVGQITVE